MHGAPLYIAETCPSQIRGTLISLKELLIVLGILVVDFSQRFNSFLCELIHFVKYTELGYWLFCSWVILLEVTRLMKWEGGATCMGLVVWLPY